MGRVVKPKAWHGDAHFAVMGDGRNGEGGEVLLIGESARTVYLRGEAGRLGIVVLSGPSLRELGKAIMRATKPKRRKARPDAR